MDNTTAMDTTKFDFSEDTEGTDKNLVQELRNTVHRQALAELQVASLQLSLSKAQEKLRNISEKELPEIMEKLGLGATKTEDGIGVKIEKKIRTSLASADKEQQVKAFNWLIDMGFDRIIKREYKVEFGKEDLAWAKKFEADMKKRKKPLNYDRKEMVHPSTLAAILLEQMELGVDVPLETFNAHVQKFAKITMPKELKEPKAKK